MAGGFRSMVSMELTDEEIADMAAPYPIDKPKGPRFPYGLCISLTHNELDKLRLDPADAEIGGLCHLHAIARVTSVSMNDGPAGPCCRVELQIEDLEVESEDLENEEEDAREREAPRARRMRALYRED